MPIAAYGLLLLNTKKEIPGQMLLIHAVNNLVLVLLALFQLTSGWQVLNAFVWGNGQKTGGKRP